MRNMLTALGLIKRPPPVSREAAAAATAGRIDALMALPIKQPAQITVFGDDAVSGVNPAPPVASNDA